MKTTSYLLLSALLVTSAFAQDDKAKGTAPQLPNPKHPEHAALEPFAGTWDITMRNEAMPGIPGMEKAGECKGTERVELVNNGLWLKSTTEGTHDGKPMQGLWLLGWDPHQKQYTGVCVCSDENNPGVMTMNGTYDAAKKTWTFTGKMPQGSMRSVMVAKSADDITETCYMTGTDGKEVKMMEITRKRSTSGAARPSDASASTGAKAPAELALLHKDIGEWDATVKCSGIPGQGPVEEKGTEKVTAICGGRWLWSDFKGQFQGQPFEGHGLVGYDPTEKKIVSIWIDSMSPTWCRTDGAPVAGSKEITLGGSCVDHDGKPMTVKQVVKHKDDATRSFEMESKGADGPSKMEITYRRKV